MGSISVASRKPVFTNSSKIIVTVFEQLHQIVSLLLLFHDVPLSQVCDHDLF
jgi:hypothetical protein